MLNFCLLFCTIFVSTPSRQADMIVSVIDFIVPGEKNIDLMKMAMIVEVLSITLTNSFIIPQLVFTIS